MKKVYVVKWEWGYDGCIDDYSNTYEDGIEAIFDDENKAVAYIQEQIKEKIECGCEGDRCWYINTIPSVEDIIKEQAVEYFNDFSEHYRYSYHEYNVR